MEQQEHQTLFRSKFHMGALVKIISIELNGIVVGITFQPTHTIYHLRMMDGNLLSAEEIELDNA